MKVGLSLSGGAARGLIHLGAMEELEKAKVPIDIIAGCSIGAVIGALYALNPNVQEVKERVLGFLDNEGSQIIPSNYMDGEEETSKLGILRRLAASLKRSVFYGISLTKPSLMSAEKLRENLSKVIPDVNFSQCKVPFGCATTDIVSNEAYYITEGPLLDAVTASCCIPGLFPPIKQNGRMLVDGSWTAQNHIEKLREMGAGYVIAVDIIQEDLSEPELSSGLDVVLRSNTATRKVMSDLQLEKADSIIRPDICEINWWDFSSSKVCMIKGSEKTSEVIAGIKKKILFARLKSFVGL